MSVLLVVEDDNQAATLLATWARQDGHHTCLAADGVAAMRIARTMPPDLAIIDMRLPDCDGCIVAARLEVISPSLPIILVTGYPLSNEAAELLKNPNTSYLLKPFSLPAIRDRIRVALTARITRQNTLAAHFLTDEEQLLQLSSILHRHSADCSIPVGDLLSTLAACCITQRLSIPVTLAASAAIRLIATSSPVDRSVIEQAESCFRTPRRNCAAFHPKILQAIARLESGGDEVLNLRESTLARDIGIDPSYLGALLRAETGLRWQQWRVGARLRVALRSLGTTNERIGQIAIAAGWSSVEQFNHEFRGLLGVTPGAFRLILNKMRDPQPDAL